MVGRSRDRLEHRASDGIARQHRVRGAQRPDQHRIGPGWRLAAPTIIVRPPCSCIRIGSTSLSCDRSCRPGASFSPSSRRRWRPSGSPAGSSRCTACAWISTRASSSSGSAADGGSRRSSRVSRASARQSCLAPCLELQAGSSGGRDAAAGLSACQHAERLCRDPGSGAGVPGPVGNRVAGPLPIGGGTR